MSCSCLVNALSELIDRNVNEPRAEDAGLRFASAFFVLGHVLLFPSAVKWRGTIPHQYGETGLSCLVYAAPAAALSANAFTPASNTGKWQLGFWMSPNSACAAVVQPPAQTGMNAQSPHSFHAASPSYFFAIASCPTSRRPWMLPTDCCFSPAKPGQA